MKTITIRDLRQRWPETEAALQLEDEILIARDSKPVAKLVRFVPATPKRKRWNPEEHAARIKKIFGNKVFPSIDRELAEARADLKSSRPCVSTGIQATCIAARWIACTSRPWKS